jgi:hypothetical protein
MEPEKAEDGFAESSIEVKRRSEGIARFLSALVTLAEREREKI